MKPKVFQRKMKTNWGGSTVIAEALLLITVDSVANQKYQSTPLVHMHTLVV